jgi:hypothetical protein
MRITPLIIAVLVMSGIMMGISGFFYGVQRVYNPGGSANSSTYVAWNDTSNKLNKTMANFEEKTAGLQSGKGTLSAYYDILLAVVDVFGVMFTIPNILISLVSSSLGFMPGYVTGEGTSWFLPMIATVIISIVALKVVAIATKTEEI